VIDIDWANGPFKGTPVPKEKWWLYENFRMDVLHMLLACGKCTVHSLCQEMKTLGKAHRPKFVQALRDAGMRHVSRKFAGWMRNKMRGKAAWGHTGAFAVFNA